MSEAIGADFTTGECDFILDPELTIEQLEALEKLLGIEPEFPDFSEAA
jgi:hypothetical protein